MKFNLDENSESSTGAQGDAKLSQSFHSEAKSCGRDEQF
jgi:hypothetical protein